MSILKGVTDPNYLADEFSLVKECEGFGLPLLGDGHLYYDANAKVITIGYGFNLADLNVFAVVLRNSGWRVPKGGLATIRNWFVTDQQGQAAAKMYSDILKAGPGDEVTLENALNAIMAQYSGPHSSATFSFANPNQAFPVSQELQSTYETNVNKFFKEFGMANSLDQAAGILAGDNERAALFDMAYSVGILDVGIVVGI